MIGGLDKKRASQWWQWLRGHPAWVVLGLTLLFAAVVRVHLLRMPLERDEGEYAYAGQLILHGVPPYKAAYNMKLPGTYAAYALIMAVFGQSPAGIHFGLLLVNAASIVLMFLLGRRLLDETAGAAAAVSFALLSLSPSVLGLAGHATHFVALPALAGTLVLIGSLKDESRNQRGELNVQRSTFNVQRSMFVVAGLLFGVAFLMKQHGIFFGLFAGLYLVWSRVAVIRAQTESLRADPGFRSQVASLKSAGRAPFKASAARGTGSVRAPSPAPAPAARPRLSHFAAAKLKGEHLTTESAKNAEVEKLQIPNSKLQASEAGAEQAGGAAAEAASRTQQAAAMTAEYTEYAEAGPEAAATPLHAPSSTLHAPTYGSLVVELTLLTAGFALPYLVTCLVLWGAGVLPQFWFWTVSYAREYAGGNSLVNGPELLKVALRSAVGPNLIFWLLPWVGALVMWWEERWERAKGEGRRAKREVGKGEDRLQPSAFSLQPFFPSPRFFLLALLVCSFAAASVGLYFREHYFILVLPVLSLLTGVAVSRGLYLVRYDRTIEVFLAVPVLLAFAIGVGAALIGDGNVWFASSPEVAHRRVYHTTLFLEAAKMAETIKANTQKGARVAVLGSEPEVYFLSGRRSATGYIYTYPLMEDQAYAKRMQEEMIREIEHGQPDYVVFVADNYSWLRDAQSPTRLHEWWQNYWPSRFDIVSTVKIEVGIESTPDSLTGLAAPPAVEASKDTSRSLDTSTATGKGSAQKLLVLLKRRR